MTTSWRHHSSTRANALRLGPDEQTRPGDGVREDENDASEDEDIPVHQLPPALSGAVSTEISKDARWRVRDRADCPRFAARNPLIVGLMLREPHSTRVSSQSISLRMKHAVYIGLNRERIPPKVGVGGVGGCQTFHDR